jgi:hypothetical protein
MSKKFKITAPYCTVPTLSSARTDILVALTHREKKDEGSMVALIAVLPWGDGVGSFRGPPSF